MRRYKGEGAGKGDTPREVNKKVYDANWDAIFAKKCDHCKVNKAVHEVHGGANWCSDCLTGANDH